MTFTVELDLGSVQRAKYLGQRSTSSKVVVWTHRQTNTLDLLLYLDQQNGR